MEALSNHMAPDPFSPLEGRLGTAGTPYEPGSPPHPFEMRFVEQNRGSNGEIPWGKAEVYSNGRMSGPFPIFEGSYYERNLIHSVKNILCGEEETVMLEMGDCSQLFFTPINNTQVTIKLGRREKPSATEPYHALVTLHREEAAYQLCRFLSDWYKHLIQGKIAEQEMRGYSYDKLDSLKLFNRPEIRSRFERDGIQPYNFAGVPDPTDHLRIEVKESDLEKALSILEQEWRGYIGKRETQEGAEPGISKYSYPVEPGRRIEIHVGSAEREARKIMHVFVPSEEHLEVLWDRLIDGARQICTQRRFEPGKGTTYFNE